MKAKHTANSHHIRYLHARLLAGLSRRLSCLVSRLLLLLVVVVVVLSLVLLLPLLLMMLVLLLGPTRQQQRRGSELPRAAWRAGARRGPPRLGSTAAECEGGAHRVY